MKCTKCGREVADDSIFCEYCGVKLASKRASLFNTLSKSSISKPSIILGIIGSIVVMFFMLFFFIIDNPKAHRCNITFGYAIDYNDNNYVRLFMNEMDAAWETPYYYKYKCTFICFEWEDNRYYNNIASRTIDGVFFAPYWKQGEDVITNWCLWIPKDRCIEFEPGTTYKATIFGVHDGIIFNRMARDIVFEFTFPSDASKYIGQIRVQ